MTLGRPGAAPPKARRCVKIYVPHGSTGHGRTGLFQQVVIPAKVPFSLRGHQLFNRSYAPRWPVATHRNRRTASFPSAALSLTMIWGAIRSSSWAHTDAAHDTVTVPARSEVGWACSAI